MTRVDVLPNGYKIFQDSKAFCFGADALLLCAFAKVKTGQNVIDLGCGNGIIELLLHSRAKGPCHFTGLELQEAAADAAKKSVAANGLQKSIDIICGDIKDCKKLFKAQSFDVVVSNPPYMKVQGSKENLSAEKRIARHEICCGIDDIASAAAFLANPNGSVFIVHRPYRLQEIFDAFSAHGLSARRARFVHPVAGKAPEMVLIEAKKNLKKELTVESPLVMYEGRDYSKEYLDFVAL